MRARLATALWGMFLTACGCQPAPSIAGGEFLRDGLRGELLRDGLRAELLGCYALYSEGGRPLGSTFYNGSPLVRLDTAVMGVTATDTFPGIVRVMTKLDAAGQPVGRVDSLRRAGPTWRADSLSDSIRLSFSNGFSGATLVVAPLKQFSDTLLGRIEEHWDFGPPFATSRGRGRAVRVPCVR